MTADFRYTTWRPRFDALHASLSPLLLRLVMAYEYFESGLEKLRGENWFASVQSDFPFPFNHVPTGLSWTMATWTELIAAALLVVGLGTRLAAFSLLVLTFVATAAVHWPDMVSMLSDLLKGYAISDKGYGNFKLPLLFSLILIPLVFGGGGRLSLDALIAPREKHVCDAATIAVGCAAIGIPFLFLVPMLGVALSAAAAGLLVVAFRRGQLTR